MLRTNQAADLRASFKCVLTESCIGYRLSAGQEKDVMVVPTVGFEPGRRQRPYAEAASQVDAVSTPSLTSRIAVVPGQPYNLVVVCSNHAFEFAAAYGLRRTAKPLRVLPAAQRER